MTFLPARPAKSRATPRQTDCMIALGWTPAKIAQMSFREASKNILTFSKKACKLTHMANQFEAEIEDSRMDERWSDEAIKPIIPALTEDVAPQNDMSVSVMAPGELFGDRLIASGLFLNCALQTLTECPEFPAGDHMIGTIVALMKNIKIELNDQLKRFPAASIQEGTVIAHGS